MLLRNSRFFKEVNDSEWNFSKRTTVSALLHHVIYYTPCNVSLTVTGLYPVRLLGQGQLGLSQHLNFPSKEENVTSSVRIQGLFFFKPEFIKPTLIPRPH